VSSAFIFIFFTRPESECFQVSQHIVSQTQEV